MGENWFHRDGLEVDGRAFLLTEPARKTDGRGTTMNDCIVIGTSRCNPRGGGGPWGTTHIVLGFINDVHHSVMTADQAIKVGEWLVREGRLLKRLHEKFPDMDHEPVPVET